MANEQGRAQCPIVVLDSDMWFGWVTSRVLGESLLEWSTKEGDSPVHH